MAIHIRRRDLISLIGGAAWPLAARAQQPAPPLIGFLSSLASSDLNLVAPAFREGLNGMGFVEGRNIAIEYRLAEGDYQRLPTLSADLVRRKVAVIAAISGTPHWRRKRQPRRFRSCLRWPATRSTPAWSAVSIGRETTLPARPSSRLCWERNAWNCYVSSSPRRRRSRCS